MRKKPFDYPEAKVVESSTEDEYSISESDEDDSLDFEYLQSTLSSSDLYLKICRSTSSNVVTRILHALEENVEKLEINHAC